MDIYFLFFFLVCENPIWTYQKKTDLTKLYQNKPIKQTNQILPTKLTQTKPNQTKTKQSKLRKLIKGSDLNKRKPTLTNFTKPNLFNQPNSTNQTHPNQTNQTKLNPTKYFKGFEMSQSSAQLLYGPVLVTFISRQIRVL